MALNLYFKPRQAMHVSLQQQQQQQQQRQRQDQSSAHNLSQGAVDDEADGEPEQEHDRELRVFRLFVGGIPIQQQQQQQQQQQLIEQLKSRFKKFGVVEQVQLIPIKDPQLIPSWVVVGLCLCLYCV